MEEKEIVENEIKSETKNETEVKTVKPKFFVSIVLNGPVL